jgi:pimeloyl-ACP methyl ester carboxylesterase
VEPTFVEGGGGIPIATWEMIGPDAPGSPRPPLLVAHATGFHTRCYRAMASALADRFRVVGFDLRGHGHSGTPSLEADGAGRVPALDWRAFGLDALAVVDAMGLDRPVAFGHSCGGATLLLAEQHRPGTFAAIYAYEPVVLPAEAWAGMADRGWDPAASARRRRPVFASKAAALENFSSKAALGALRGDVLVDYVEGGFVERPDGAVGLRCDPATEATTYAMAPHADTWDRLPEVACPVTVACGGARADLGVDVATAVAGRLQHGRVEEHADLGHLGPFEAPEDVAEAVAAALGA